MGDLNYKLDFTQSLPPATQEKIAEGMKAADDHANERWKHIIQGCILAAARRLAELTVDDVIEEYEKLPEAVRPTTHALDALGPAMRRARQQGILKPTNRIVRGKRAISHGNRHSVWLSNYFVKKESQ